MDVGEGSSGPLDKGSLKAMIVGLNNMWYSFLKKRNRRTKEDEKRYRDGQKQG